VRGAHPTGMFLVEWIFNAPFGRCYRLGAFYASLMFIGARSAPYGYVIGGVDFMYRSSMLLVGWIFYAPFGRCYWWGGFLMYRSVDVICRMHFMHR
jgi:hypothetical protein